MRVDVAPRMSREGFVKVLEEAQSPAAPVGGACYDAIAALGADPAVGLAFFQHESTFGTKGKARETHNWGNLRPGSGWALQRHLTDGVHDNFLQFTHRNGEAAGWEWVRSAGCWAILVMELYTAKDVDKILVDYAPGGPPDFNQPKRYTEAVEQAVERWADLYPYQDEEEPEPPATLQEQIDQLRAILMQHLAKDEKLDERITRMEIHVVGAPYTETATSTSGPYEPDNVKFPPEEGGVER